MRVLFIAINYGSNSYAERLMDRVSRYSGRHELECVVIDNTDRRENARWVADNAARYARIRIHASGENLGYFGGAFRAVQVFEKEAKAADVVVVSNVDIDLPDVEAFFSALECNLEPGIGLLAPTIHLGESGFDLNPNMRVRPSRWRIWFYVIAFKFYFTFRLYHAAGQWKRMLSAKENARADASMSDGKDIYAPHGSLICFTKEFFERGGTLRFPVFLFGEELFVAEQARQMGLRVRYCPEAKATHVASVSVRKVPSRNYWKFKRESMTFIWRTYFKPRRAATAHWPA